MTCPDAFNCLNLEIKNGKTYISSCCIMSTWEVETVDFENDPNFLRIRQQWTRGEWPQECNVCKINEDQGLQSRRLGAFEWNKNNLDSNTDYHNKILKIDYWTGNNCNLRCAICGPRYSIAWEKELGIEKHKRITYTNQLWKDITVDEVHWIHFNGGEPLLVDEHWKLLKKINNKNQVVLNYNTNGSVRPKQELIDLWSQFKIVILDFSIDDIEDRFEYQRYPARWKNVVENLYWFKEHLPVNVMFEVNTALGILNYYSYLDLQKWFSKNFATNRATDPVRLKTQDTMGILSYRNKNKKQIVDYLNTLDARRNTNWKTTFPELIEKLL